MEKKWKFGHFSSSRHVMVWPKVALFSTSPSRPFLTHFLCPSFSLMNFVLKTHGLRGQASSAHRSHESQRKREKKTKGLSSTNEDIRPHLALLFYPSCTIAWCSSVSRAYESWPSGLSKKVPLSYDSAIQWDQLHCNYAFFFSFPRSASEWKRAWVRANRDIGSDDWVLAGLIANMRPLTPFRISQSCPTKEPR